MPTSYTGPPYPVMMRRNGAIKEREDWEIVGAILFGRMSKYTHTQRVAATEVKCLMEVRHGHLKLVYHVIGLQPKRNGFYCEIGD